MKRLAVIAGVPVAVTLAPSDARSLAVRRLRRADPTDDRPAQAHAWAPGYGSAWGDTIEEACDQLAAQHRAVFDPAARVGVVSPAERVVLLQGPRRRLRPAVEP